MSDQLLTLRDYQRVGVDALMDGWRGGTRRQAVVWPTGAGKTVGFAHVALMARQAGAGFLALAHRDELIEQAADKLRQIAPGLRVGIVKGARRQTLGVDGVVASVQTLGRNPAVLREVRDRIAPRLIIVDEAHHAVADTYMTILRELGGFEDDYSRGALVAGFTATLARGDRVALDQVWQHVAHRVPIEDLIRRGYLLVPRGRRVKIDGLELARMRKAAGDYSDAALGSAMHDVLAPEAIARAYREFASDRQGIAFLPTVALAYEQAEAFCAAGIPALAVDGSSRTRDRRAAIEASRRGDCQVLCNSSLWTEGADLPWINCVVPRMTLSAVLYVQMVGRGLRPYPGQRDCLVLDPTGVGARHRLASLVDLGGADRVEQLPDYLTQYEDDEGISLGEDDGYGAVPRPRGADGPLTSEEFELLAEASHSAWLRTARGVWFLDTGEWLIFLTPGDGVGRYGVAKCRPKMDGGEFIRRDLDLGYAMSWGEQVARETENTYASKRAGWRRTVPSTSQVNRAARLGIVLPPGARKGEVSDALSVHNASWRLDDLSMVAGVTPRGYW